MMNIPGVVGRKFCSVKETKRFHFEIIYLDLSQDLTSGSPKSVSAYILCLLVFWIHMNLHADIFLEEASNTSKFPIVLYVDQFLSYLEYICAFYDKI